ncbi:MAG: hypothetical protein HY331_19375 [Chloroflexi bacterium]|nr:hypothetical protein [Chloroflexota bacterium]
MRVVVIGAGGPAGVNVCRALHAAGCYVVGVDENGYHLPWAEPFCAETMTCPPMDDPSYLAILTSALGDVDDVIHAQPERAVRWLAENRERLADPAAERRASVLLPPLSVIEACQDKRRACELWHAAGLRRTKPVPVGAETPDWLHVARDICGLPFWLRAARGAGARGATLVEDLRGGYHWLRYWHVQEPSWEWIAEEYLPGRDYCWTSLWHSGRLVAGFLRERLEWIYPHLTPTGRTGTPAVAVTVHDKSVSIVASEAVLAVDPAPHGIYAVDLREDRDGIPRPTEINAGRWPTTSPLYHQLGPNLPDLHAQLAAGRDVEPAGDNIYPAGVYLLRHIDCGHLFTTADQLIPAVT